MIAHSGRTFGLCVWLGVVVSTAAAQAPRESTPAPAPAAPLRRPSALIVETRVVGVDPIVGRFIDRQLRQVLASLGHVTMTASEARSLMQALAIHYPPSAAELEPLARRAQVQHALFATASARGGQYVVRLDVVSIDHRSSRSTPGWAEAASGTQDLGQMLDGLARQLLAPHPTPASRQPAVSAPPPTPHRAPPRAAAAVQGPVATADEPVDEPEAPSLEHHWRLALQTEPAFGIADDFFYNHLFGGRVDYRFDEATSLGLYLAYANLRGRDARVGSALFYAQLDHRIAIEGTSLSVPVRWAAGYLARNGVVIRTASGIAWPLAERIEVVLDLLTPVLWVTPERRLLSLDVAVEVAWLM